MLQDITFDTFSSCRIKNSIPHFENNSFYPLCIFVTSLLKKLHLTSLMAVASENRCFMNNCARLEVTKPGAVSR